MAEVEQKLQPSGQPTDGISVAATSPGRSFDGRRPALRVPMPGDDQRMADGLVLVLAQEPPEPAHALALDDVVGVDPLVQIGDVGDVPADDDRRVRLVLADQLAHLLHLEQVGDDRA